MRWALFKVLDGLEQSAAFVVAFTLQRAIGLSRHDAATPTLDDEARKALRDAYVRCLLADTAWLKTQHSPFKHRFSRPYAQWLKGFPDFLWDARRVAQRRSRGDFQQTPPRAANYPAYYRRTFHWQSDGYFTERSAARYDFGVEVLFLGAADAMRRQALARVLERQESNVGVQWLDVACGTGRFASMVRRARPDINVTGLDLSAAYLRFARRIYGLPSMRWKHGDVCALPYADGSFDVVSSIYLLHELPRRARFKALAEMLRVLRPGGLLLVADSLQDSDAPRLAPLLRAFSRDFHEPFYRDYCQTPLEPWLQAQVTLEAVESHTAFVTKIVTARRTTNPAQK